MTEGETIPAVPEVPDFCEAQGKTTAARVHDALIDGGNTSPTMEDAIGALAGLDYSEKITAGMQPDDYDSFLDGFEAGFRETVKVYAEKKAAVREGAANE